MKYLTLTNKFNICLFYDKTFCSVKVDINVKTLTIGDISNNINQHIQILCMNKGLSYSNMYFCYDTLYIRFTFWEINLI